MAKNTKKTAKKPTAKKPAGKKPATKKPTKPATKKPAQKKPSAKKTTGKTTRKTTPKKAKTTPKQKTSGTKKASGRGKKTPAKRKTTSGTKSSDKKSSVEKGKVKKKKISEFRAISQSADKFAGHPVYAYNKIDEDLLVLVITHDRRNSNSSKVKELEKNPAPKDDEKAKIHKKARIVNKKLCGRRYKGWTFKTNKDKEQVKEIITSNKGKKLERIEKKK